jgi:Glyoxalase-like domain
MTLRVQHMIISSRDPERLAEFWSAALGAGVSRHLRGYLLEPSVGSRVLISEGEPGRDGSLGLDLNSSHDTLKAEVARLTELGAVIVDDRPRGGMAMVGLGRVLMADPEGNEFAVWSSDAEVQTVIDAKEAQAPNTYDDPDLSWSYFAGAPLDPAAGTPGGGPAAANRGD